MAEQRCDRPRWDPIPGYLPGNEPHVLSGASGAGKTTLTALMVSKLVASQPFLGHATQAPPLVVLILGDRTARDTVEKYERQGVKLGRGGPVHCYSLADDLTPEGRLLVEQLDKAKGPSSPFPVLTRAAQVLGDEVDPLGARRDREQGRVPRWPPGTLVVIDGMAAVLGIEPAGRFLRDVAKPLLRFSQWLLEHSYTAVLIHQQAKAKGDAKQRWARKQDAILGSMALHAGTGTQMALLEPEITGHGAHEFLWVPHGAAKELVKLVRGPTGQFDAVGEALAGPAAEAAIAGANCDLPDEMRGYLDLLDFVGVPIMQVQARAEKLWGHSRAKAYRLLGQLKGLGRVESDDRGRWRRLVQGGS